jgi:hypothetical protein
MQTKFLIAAIATVLAHPPVNAQNVGIGTPTPLEKLSVETVSHAYGVSHSDGVIKLSTYVGGNINGGYIGTVSNHSLGFYVNNGSSRLTITQNGFININGLLTLGFPEDAVTLWGGLTYRNWDGFDQQWTLRTGTNGRFVFRYNNLSLSYIDNNSGGYFTLSDIRLKDHIVNYKPVLKDIMDLNVCTYQYKQNKTGATTLGLIAQNVSKHFPELTIETNDTDGEPLLAVDYTKTGVIAIKAIQEQQQLIRQQQAEITELRQRLSLLETKMQQY